jgi:hypothetical protein
LLDVYRPSEPNGFGIIAIQGTGWYSPMRYDAAQLKSIAAPHVTADDASTLLLHGDRDVVPRRQSENVRRRVQAHKMEPLLRLRGSITHFLLPTGPKAGGGRRWPVADS